MYQVIIDTAFGKKVFATGEYEHCLNSIDLAENQGYDAELVGPLDMQTSF
jgi:hypothetical protein